jgi:hypothetical protein
MQIPQIIKVTKGFTDTVQVLQQEEEIAQHTHTHTHTHDKEGRKREAQFRRILGKKRLNPPANVLVAVCVYIDFLILRHEKTIRIIFSRSCWSFTGLVKSVLHYFYYYLLILLSDGVIYFILQWQFDMKVQFISS